MSWYPLCTLTLIISLLLGHGVYADSTAPLSVERVFEAVHGSPPRLRVFLQAMPKGGELHTHLWGVPSAEDFLGWAAEDGSESVGTRTSTMRTGWRSPIRSTSCRKPWGSPSRDR